MGYQDSAAAFSDPCDGLGGGANAPLAEQRHGKKVSPLQTTAGLFAGDCSLFVAFGVLPIPAAGQMPAGVGGLLQSKELIAVLFALGAFLICQKAIGGYRSRLVVAGGQSISRLAVSLFVTFALLVLLGAATKVTQSYSRLWFFSWMGACAVVLPAVRWFVLTRLRRQIAGGAYACRALSVGFMAEPLGAPAVSWLSNGLARSVTLLRVTGADGFDTLGAHVRDRKVEEIYISVPWQSAPDVLKSLRRLRQFAANVYVVPLLGEGEPLFAGAWAGGGQLRLQAVSRPIGGWAYVEKRASDIIIAWSALLLMWPVMLLTALAIKLESRGPVLFRQQRQGVNGQQFELLKFRSMRENAMDRDAERQTSRGDDRVTRVGRFIRRTSIDELPQLFNVIRGDMSIVGPRPHALKTKAEGLLLDSAIDDYAARHRVKPGMTGWAQVNGLRGELDTIEKLRRRVDCDIEYINGWSLGWDLRIVLRTLVMLLRDPMAY